MDDQGHWVTVFDIAQTGYRNWWFPAFGLIFVTVGSLVTFFPRASEALLPHGFTGRARRPFGIAMLALALSWTGFAFVSTFSGYLSARAALDEDRAKVVEAWLKIFMLVPSRNRSTLGTSISNTPIMK